MAEAIRVLARIRPSDGKKILRCGIGGDSVVFDEKKEFPVDTAIGSAATQEDVYACVGPDALQTVLDGYNSAVMCYGQTGSGKTYTMLGTKEEPGLAPRIMNDLLSREHEGMTCEVSAVQIYNEVCYDLFYIPEPGEKRKMKEVKVREVSSSVFGIPSATRRRLIRGNVGPTLDEVEEKRVVAKTAMNASSSRSHVILMVEVEQVIEHKTMYSTVYLVDLAGSEDVNRSCAVGQTVVEAGNINRSLASLKGVIIALSDPKTRDGFINFRSSALTKLLRDCMGGNSVTVLVTNMSASVNDEVETKSTLEFGQLSRRVVNHVSKNYRMCYQDMLHEVYKLRDVLFGAQQDIRNLRRQLPNFTDTIGRKGHGIPDDFICPLSALYEPNIYKPMTDPVVASDGVTYELQNLRQRFLATKSLPGALPPFDAAELTYFPDYTLKALIRDWKMERLWPCDVLGRIFAYCTAEELLSASLSCSLWASKVTDNEWKRLAVLEFSHRVKPKKITWKQHYLQIASFRQEKPMRYTTYGLTLVSGTAQVP